MDSASKSSLSRLSSVVTVMVIGAVIFSLGFLQPYITSNVLPYICEPSSSCPFTFRMSANGLPVMAGQSPNALAIGAEAGVQAERQKEDDGNRYGDTTSSVSGGAARSSSSSQRGVRRAAGKSTTLRSDTATKSFPPSASCDGRRIYLYDLPSSMNDDLVSPEGCWKTDVGHFCHYVKNNGLGRRLGRWMDERPTLGVIPDIRNSLADVSQAWRNRWYFSSLRMLDLMMFRRLQNYTCLETNASKADAFFIPTLVAWDWWSVMVHGETERKRDDPVRELAAYLTKQQPFIQCGGKNHFLAVGRSIWDLIRETGDEQSWGMNLLNLPEFANVTLLVTETAGNHNRPNRIVSVPNPTGFHPASQAELDGWLARVRAQERPYLYTVLSSMEAEETAETNHTARGEQTAEDKLRQVLLEQCRDDPRCLPVNCSRMALLDFAPSEVYTGVMRDRMEACMDPRRVASVMTKSRFCLEPAGRNRTSRVTFDAMTSGCIPVHLQPEAFEQQFEWLFPRDRSSMAVQLPVEDVLGGNIRVGDELAKISNERVEAMREEGLMKMPQLLWWDHTADGRNDFRDLFDVIIEKVLLQTKQK